MSEKTYSKNLYRGSQDIHNASEGFDLLEEDEKIKIVTELAKSEDAQKRSQAADGAGYLGEKGLEILENLVYDKEPPVRYIAVQAMGKLGPLPRVLELFALLITDKDPDLRRSLPAPLALLGEAGRGYLKSLMEDEDDSVRSYAIKNLAQLGPEKE